MSQITFPQFSNMQPVAEDLQLIIDSLRTETRNRLTADGIFNPGIVGQKSDYLSKSINNTIKIKPFIAYTQNGNRIEVLSTFDKLSPQGSTITITSENIVNEYINIPVWSSYTFDYDNYLAGVTTPSKKFVITELGKGSVLHGIKLRTSSIFASLEGDTNVTISIGTEEEPTKFLPETLISDSDSSKDLSVMNLMYSIDDDNTTPIIITFNSDALTLGQLASGVLKVNLCIANLSGFDNESLVQTTGGYNLSTGAASWQASTLYYIVARYKETESDFRNLVYKDNNGVTITTNPEAARLTTGYQLLALRKSGSTIDSSTLDDVKLGEINTDDAGNIFSVNINGKNEKGEDYTQYLTIPGHRLVTNIDATQIGDGLVTNTQFNYLSTLTSNVQTQLNIKASLTGDNVFTGLNTFTTQIDGDIKTVNGYTAYATPVANSLLVLDENGKVPADAISESTLAGIGNPYTVSSGITTNGRSSFITPNADRNGVILTATEENPLVFNYPDGSTEKITSNVSVDGLAADGYYYLVKEKNGNYYFLPTVGGTKSVIPVVSANNSFAYEDSNGTVTVALNAYKPNAYKAFDGTITSYAQLGKVHYTYYNNFEEFVGTPSDTSTYIQIDFPYAVTPTGFATCFRTNATNVCTPKSWIFAGSNDDWEHSTDLATANNESWNENEIKTISTVGAASYTSFRFIFNVTAATINNYVEGEETPYSGIDIPINCYYFQIYATNTDTTNKGNITEGYTFPANPSVSNYHLDISKKPFTGYKSTGSAGANAWVKVNFVKLGFVNLTDYGTVNKRLVCYPFSYNSFTISDDDSFVLAPNTEIIFNHNLGVIPNIIDMKFKCVVANNGYAVGDTVSDIYVKDTNNILRSAKNIISMSVLDLVLYPAFTDDTFYVLCNDTGSANYRKLITTTGTNWQVIFYCARGW